MMSSLILGVAVHKYGLHKKIPLISHALNLFEERKEAPFFYPASKQGTSELFKVKDIKYPFEFICYGDSIVTSGEEVEDVIERVISEEPSFVLHLGDLVQFGDEHNWKIFDIFTGKIIDKGIPFYPVLGNHEYHTRKELYPPDPEKQLKHYYKRFKILDNNRWYSFVYGNSQFLILDSNTDYDHGSEQYKWLINKLQEKSQTSFSFIAIHHPLYSKGNYKIREAEEKLATLLESYNDVGLIKPDIVFSAHNHNYERYKHNDINYVVSGGGGAPQMPVNRNSEDFYNRKGNTYHYCKIKVSENKVLFEMIRLDEDTEKWIISDTFKIIK